ncbi:regulatory subunit of cyclin-dependent kinase [Mycena olivaceomarginata]|nr:regulatory subunit of cyclin-dependent kinase [Mycena olivaceomarginata]
MDSGSASESPQLTKEQQEQRTLEGLIEKIHYSDRYTDDAYEYRHVILPKPLLRLVPKQFFNEELGVLRLLSEPEWRGIGITQSLGWEHYEVHAPETPRPAIPTTEGFRPSAAATPTARRRVADNCSLSLRFPSRTPSFNSTLSYKSSTLYSAISIFVEEQLLSTFYQIFRLPSALPWVRAGSMEIDIEKDALGTPPKEKCGSTEDK